MRDFLCVLLFLGFYLLFLWPFLFVYSFAKLIAHVQQEMPQELKKRTEKRNKTVLWIVLTGIFLVLTLFGVAEAVQVIY